MLRLLWPQSFFGNYLPCVNLRLDDVVDLHSANGIDRGGRYILDRGHDSLLQDTRGLISTTLWYSIDTPVLPERGRD